MTSYMRQNIAEDTAKILLSSITNSTLKQYNVHLKEWWEFCQENNLDVFSASEEKILLFLTKKFINNASYSTLNCARSAINMLYREENKTISIIGRFFKGIFNLKPPKPRYNETWDVDKILDYIEDLGSTRDLSLADLSKKLVLLLSIATGQRLQTLANIRINDIKKSKEEIQIRVPARLKTSRPNAAQPLLILPFLREKPLLCVASALIIYIKKTEKLRGQEEKLFIAIRKPFKKVSVQTISRWINQSLKEAGIDIKIFSAYSIRHASTSAALAKGVDIETIKRTAGWSTKSLMFSKFYNRPIIPNNKTFATMVLTKKNK